MPVNRLRLSILIGSNLFSMMLDHHLKKQPEDWRQTQQVGWRCHQIQRNRLFIIHEIIYTEITHNRILSQDWIQIFLQGCIGRGNNTAAFIFRLG